MTYVSVYADLSWFEGLDEKGYLEVERYRTWAIGNTYTLEILMGNVSVFPEYMQLLQDNPNEILTGLLTIMESANTNELSVDNILEKFKEVIMEYQSDDQLLKLSNGYMISLNRLKCANLCYQIAIYQFSNKRYAEGIRNVFLSITIYAIINKKGGIIDSMSLFEKYRIYASEEELEEYNNIIKRGSNNENSGGHVNFSYQFK